MTAAAMPQARLLAAAPFARPHAVQGVPGVEKGTWKKIMRLRSLTSLLRR